MCAEDDKRRDPRALRPRPGGCVFRSMTSNTCTHGPTYSLLADLPLLVNGYRLEGLAKPWSSTFTRRSTVVHLFGGEEEGVGEDVTYTPDDHEPFQGQGGHLPLAGAFTLREFSELLDEYDLFSRTPAREDSREHRRWAFESAALDLALRQSGLSLAGALGVSPEPVEFVVSFRLDDGAPSIRPVAERLALYPSMRFKIDTSSSWSADLIAELDATGAVVSVDFKGHYDGLPVPTSVDPELYARVITGLSGAWLEDPALTAETEALLSSSWNRVTWDAPIRSVADITSLARKPVMVNVKPSRFGRLKALLDTYDHLAKEGIRAYGGGQFELGPGRGQIQYLAALFHPHAPNDVAPIVHHEIRAGLPTSPLEPTLEPIGFRTVE